MHIRAFALAAALVGPAWLSSAEAQERQTIAICSRAGCDATVIAGGERGTQSAWAQATVTEPDAVANCEDYVMPGWREQGRLSELIQCVKNILAERGGKVLNISANCTQGTYTGWDGRTWRVTERQRRSPDTDP